MLSTLIPGRLTAVRTNPLKSFRAIDRLTLLYILVATIVLIAHFAGWRGADPSNSEVAWLVTAHVLVVALAVLAPFARAQNPSKHNFWAEWYPAFIMTGLYSSVGLLNGGEEWGGVVVFDRLVQRWDVAVFGHDIAKDTIRNYPSAWISWILNLSYLAYYVLIICSPAVLWAKGKRGAARQALFAICLIFFICYIVFLFFPVAGPQYFWSIPSNAYTRTGAARLVYWIMERGDAWGSAFPSSHVAAAVVATVFAFRGWKPLGWVLLLPTLGICLAVVFTQVHYGVDALAGLLLAALICPLIPLLCPVEEAPNCRAVAAEAAVAA